MDKRKWLSKQTSQMNLTEQTSQMDLTDGSCKWTLWIELVYWPRIQIWQMDLANGPCRWTLQMDLADWTLRNDLMDRPLGRITQTDLADRLLRQTLSTWSTVISEWWSIIFTAPASLKIRQSTIYYAGSLGRWDKWIVDQASDVPSIIFFKFLIDSGHSKLFIFVKL